MVNKFYFFSNDNIDFTAEVLNFKDIMQPLFSSFGAATLVGAQFDVFTDSFDGLKDYELVQAIVKSFFVALQALTSLVITIFSFARYFGEEKRDDKLIDGLNNE